jgi:hypothetical protein
MICRHGLQQFSLTVLLFSSFAAFTALLEPQDRLMGLGLPDGAS